MKKDEYIGILTSGALKFYAQFADVVVLARELNLEQVAEIYRQIHGSQMHKPFSVQIHPLRVESKHIS